MLNIGPQTPILASILVAGLSRLRNRLASYRNLSNSKWARYGLIVRPQVSSAKLSCRSDRLIHLWTARSSIPSRRRHISLLHKRS